jgi:hypothetical protein
MLKRVLLPKAQGILGMMSTGHMAPADDSLQRKKVASSLPDNATWEREQTLEKLDSNTSVSHFV